jgi:hypothetical protein
MLVKSELEDDEAARSLFEIRDIYNVFRRSTRE